MERRSLTRWPCTIARAADQLADPWTVLILRDVFLGRRRFADFAESLPIAPNMLTRRLQRLTALGLLEARAYSRRPPRSEYALTPKGNETLPVLLALATWGARWASPQGAPLVLVDAASRKPVRAVMVDERSGKKLVPGSVGVLPGPGASSALRKGLKRPAVFTGRPS
jgi:DNA-binding HxlR family transcriptional regulator